MHTAATMPSGGRVLGAFLLEDPTGEAKSPEGLNTARSHPAGSLPDSRDQISGDNHRILCPLPRGLFNPTPHPTVPGQPQGAAGGLLGQPSGGLPLELPGGREPVIYLASLRPACV